MKHSPLLTAAALITGLLLPSAAFGWTDWKTMKDDNFTIFYKPGYEQKARELYETMEQYRPWTEQHTGGSAKNLSIAIQSLGTESNGYTDPVNRKLVLYDYPPSGGELGFVEDWWTTVGVHEYTHYLSMTNVSGGPRVISTIFGSFFYPNIFIPGWVAEGITVYNESQLSRYSGRLNDGTYDAYIAASASEGKMPPILKATYLPLEYPQNGSYLYGGEFFRYLSQTYGEEKLALFFSEQGGSVLSYFSPIIPAFSLDRSARRVFGKSFRNLWSDWETAELEKHKAYRPAGERLTDKGWYMSDPVAGEGKTYYKRMYPVKTGAYRQFYFNEIIERDNATGRERVVVSLPGSLSATPLKLRGGSLYYASMETRSGYDNVDMLTYGVYSRLHRKELASGRDRVLFSDGLRAFGVLSDGSVLFAKDRADAFGSELWRYSPSLRKKEKLFVLDCLVSEIEDNGRHTVIVAKHPRENFNIYTLDIGTGKVEQLIRTPYLAQNAALAGDRLFFSSNIDGSHALYAYDFTTAKTSRLTETGYAESPAYDEKNGDVYFTGMTAGGTDLFRTKAQFTEYALPEYARPSVAIPRPTATALRQGGYGDNLKTLKPTTHLPFLFASSSGVVAGVMLGGQTALGDFGYSASAYFDSEKGRGFYGLGLTSNFLAPVNYYVSASNVDDGTLLTGFQYPLVSRLSPGLSGILLGAGYRAFDRFERREYIPSLTTGFQYPFTQGTLMVSLPFESRDLNSTVTRQGLYATAAVRQYLPSSELTGSVTRIDDTGNPDDVFPVLRGYRDASEGHDGYVYTAEYSHPIIRVRNGFWNPNLYIEDLSIAFFGEAAEAQNVERQYDGGMELHTEINSLFGMLPAKLVLGGAYNKEHESSFYCYLTTIF